MPNSTAGMIIGKAGHFITEVKNQTGAFIQVSQKSKEMSLAERCITVGGTACEATFICFNFLHRIHIYDLIAVLYSCLVLLHPVLQNHSCCPGILRNVSNVSKCIVQIHFARIESEIKVISKKCSAKYIFACVSGLF